MKIFSLDTIKSNILPLILYIALWGIIEAIMETYIPSNSPHLRIIVFTVIITGVLLLMYNDDDKEKKKT